MNVSEREALEQADLPLVLLPGTLCDARIFEPLLDFLPSVLSRVLLTTHALTMAEAATEVLAQAPQEFALLGFSLGGMVAMETTLRAAGRVCGLALLSTSPWPVPLELHQQRRTIASTACKFDIQEFVEQQLWPGYESSKTDDKSLRLLQGMAASLGHTVFATQTELALSREDFRPRLKKITCPTLIVAGEEDKLGPPAAQDDLLAGIPHAVRLMIPDTGHLAVLERSDEIAQAVAAWLETAKQERTRRNKDRPGLTGNKEHG